MYNTTHTDTYLPADNGPITNPQQILQTIEADAQKEDKPTNPGPEPHPTATPQLPEPSAPDGIAALSYLLRFLTPHIERMVEKKFAALVQNHNTLAQMDENLEDKMREIADAAIYDHVNDKDHPDEDDVTSRVEDTIETYLRRNHGFVTEDRVNDIVSEAIEQHEDDTNHIEEWEIDDKLENFVSTEKINEQMEEALREVLQNFTVTLTPKA